MKTPSLLEMLQAGVHFGHQSSRWHPKMGPFIFGQRNGVHVINLEKTQEYISSTLDAVRKLAAEGKQILFITTKPQAREIVKQAAVDCGMPYLVERWIGGMLTNFPEVKRLLKKYKGLKQQQEEGGLEHYTKKERVQIAKELEKMEVTLAGLVDLEHIPDAIFIPAMQREKTAVKEANRMHVPIIGICDTNANPEKAEWVIPANDDAVKSITLMVNLVAEAVKEGKAEFEKNKKKEIPNKDKVEEKK